MSIVKWIHFSDLHLNTQGVETESMREELPRFLAQKGIRCDYAFCTGDLRFAPDGTYPAETAAYIKEVCAAAQVPLEHLFVVPGNHDVNRGLPGRQEAVEHILRTYRAREGTSEQPERDLAAIHPGQEAFRAVLAELFDGMPDRLRLYDDPNRPHFTVTTEHFNILHLDTTLTYGKGHENDLLVMRDALWAAIKTMDKQKPTILLAHHAITSLAQAERSTLSELLYRNNIQLWLAGHEHDHNLTPYKYLYSVQAGELRIEDQTNATVLVGEYDTESGTGFLKAYTWLREGWAEYPIIWHGFMGENEEENKFPFHLGISAGDDPKSREEQACSRANQSHIRTGIDPRILPGIRQEASVYSEQGALGKLLDDLWQKGGGTQHLVLLAEGGMGKTTLLQHALSTEQKRTLLYIALEQLEAAGLGIEQHICRVLYNSGDKTERLYSYVKNKETHPQLVVLLDGFNEIGSTAQERFCKEIRVLSQYRGLQLVVTSREDFTQRLHLPFSRAELLELSDEQMMQVLGEETWPQLQEQHTLKRLLRNPMMLLMYKQVCPVMQTHQEEFLDWITPIENETHLMHNYFVAQEAILMDREDVKGEKLLLTCQCIRYALPYIGFCMEEEGRLTIPEETFQTIADRAAEYANSCTFLPHVFGKIQRRYRVRALPKISGFDVEDYLVNEAHLLHQANQIYSFDHQMYRDYLSATWLVQMGEQEPELWERRIMPFYLHPHLRNMGGTYWTGLAKRLADSARGKDGSEVGKLVHNLVEVFRYTPHSGVPDYSGLDLRDVRLRNVQGGVEKVRMHGARISSTSLSLLNRRPDVFRCLSLSAAGEWLAALSEGVLHIWSLATHTIHLLYAGGYSNASVFFLNDNRHLFLNAKPRRPGEERIDVFANDGEWKYACSIECGPNELIRAMIVAEDILHVYYNNREQHYRLTDGEMVLNRRQKHAWKTPAAGEPLPAEFIHRRSAKQMQDVEGLLYRHSRGEFTACAYADGALNVYQNGELYARLATGIEILKAAAISGDGKRAITLSRRVTDGIRRMQMWDLETRCRCGDRALPEQTTNIHLSASGDWIIGEMTEGYQIWRWSDEQDTFVISQKLVSNQYGKLTSYQNKVLLKNEEQALEVFDLDTRTCQRLHTSCKNVHIASFLPNGDLVVVGNNARKAMLASTRSGVQLCINSENAAISGLFCMKNQPFVGLATRNGVLSMYHTGTGQRTRILRPDAGNRILVSHPSKDACACSGGRNRFEIYNFFSFQTKDGRNAGKWYENLMTGTQVYGNVLDMDFNETNEELVTIMSDGTIVYSHELYCKYHSSTKIITNFDVNSYDFSGVICDAEIQDVLKSNGAQV